MQIDEKTFLVNSPIAVLAFVNFMQALFRDHKYITFTWRIGADRSLDQNALLHVWLTEYAAHLLNKAKKAVTEAELEGIKKTAKMRYYTQTGFEWLIVTAVNPWSGEEYKPQLRSSKKYTRGEMFLFLTWLQDTAAGDGLVLESRGEYAKLQKEAA